MNLEDRARKAGAEYYAENGGKILIDFFSDPYSIRFPGVEFCSASKRAVSLVTRVLLLHYLLRADGTPPSNKWEGYKDIPGGLLYGGVFARRVTEPLQKRFGRSARVFQETGLSLGGVSAGVGDASFILQVLPFIRLQYVLWAEDDEFPPSVQLLFDSSVVHYLSLEDIVVLGQMSTGRLINRAINMADRMQAGL